MFRVSKTLRKQGVGATDVSLFFISLAAGVIGAGAAKYVLHLPQLLVTAVPVLAMLVYALLVWLSGRYRLREDQAGDSLYYLGFLFTLISLAASLYEFNTEGGTEQLIANFGIAIATTIVGIALRVMFNQMRRDPVEIERESRMEMAQAAVRLRSELDQATLEFTSFRRAMQQQVGEGLDDMGEKTSRVLEGSLGSFQSIIENAAHRIEEALASFTQNAERQNRVTATTVSAVEGLTARLEAIEVPTNLVTQAFQPLTQALSRLNGRLEQHSLVSESLNTRTSELAAGASQMSATWSKSMEETAGVLRNTASTLKDFDVTVGNIKESLSAAHRALQAHAEAAFQVDRSTLIASEIRTARDSLMGVFQQMLARFESRESYLHENASSGSEPHPGAGSVSPADASAFSSRAKPSTSQTDDPQADRSST